MVKRGLKEVTEAQQAPGVHPEGSALNRESRRKEVAVYVMEKTSGGLVAEEQMLWEAQGQQRAEAKLEPQEEVGVE